MVTAGAGAALSDLRLPAQAGAGEVSKPPGVGEAQKEPACSMGLDPTRLTLPTEVTDEGRRGLGVPGQLCGTEVAITNEIKMQVTPRPSCSPLPSPRMACWWLDNATG